MKKLVDKEIQKLLDKASREIDNTMHKVIKTVNNDEVYITRENGKIKVINPKVENSLFPSVVKRAIKS